MKGIIDWLRGLSAPWVVVLALVGVSLFVAGSVTAYRTYDYIEHDNDFCMSCHLMAEPFERFAQSAHRDLGCKACHKPSFAGRTQMALTQVIENPEEISVHAEVPNEKCASCHIEGDPEKWALVANSAGHRAHLESDDPELDGLMCVQCHSSGVHEFAATDKTCAQAGCHEEVEVRLGRMGDFTIHCAACHGFNSVLEEGTGLEAAQAALAPSADECLSCHAMRALVDMPPDEPHEQVCATCHNPHEQVTPAQAEETCATVGCHNDMRELTAFHRGLDHTSVENCMSCHQAHDFRLDGNDCLSCHQDIFDDVPGGSAASRALGASASPHPGIAARTLPAVAPSRPAATTFAGFGLGLPPSSFLHGDAPQEAPPSQERRRPLISTGEVVFRHGNHREVECVECHDSSNEHGLITLESITDCRSCHHTEPVATQCRDCHTPSVLAPQPLTARGWRMDFSVGQGATRDIPFLHRDHIDEDCATCHQEGLQRPPDVASCNSCHEEHHQDPAEVSCITCHRTPAEDAHDLASHTTCAGAGCHENPPVEAAPFVRNGCLSCHQDLVDHEPAQECADCHALPQPIRGVD